VELGVKFTADVAGKITGVRFYKGPQNTGTHTGSLWSSSGSLLATATFTGESSTGWQTVAFSNPVTVAAGTTYIASYRAPQGFYSHDAGGLSAAVDSAPLHALSSGGVFTYGAGAPTSTWNGANYWVDVVFMPSDSAPVVSSTSPDGGATNVNGGTNVAATFGGPIQDGTAQLVLKDGSGTSVAGALSYSATTRTATMIPVSSLADGVTYTATVSGAKALSGAAMVPYSWSFTVAGAATCPCSLFQSSSVPATIDSGDGSSVELGVGFVPQVDGRVTGVRFYKSTANTGTHVGSLWNSSGTRLATVTFSGESASGWQTASFATPVNVTASSRYVISYLAPNGHYSSSSHFFDSDWKNGPLVAPGGPNGLYRYGSGGFPNGSYASTNYWVDVAFSPLLATTPPDIIAEAPLDQASSVPAGTAPTATFSMAIDPSTLNFTLRAASGTSVAGVTSYDSTSKKATFTPASALAPGVVYTAAVQATSTTGATMAPPATWSFTTAQPSPSPGVCPCSIWDDAMTPATISETDPNNVELGMKFTADVNGQVTGVRFYKAPDNSGAHSVSLWTESGTLLATATAANESTTGWQTVTFASPLNVTAGVTYAVSYRAPQGHYSTSSGGLSSVIDTAPLHTVAGGGLYTYGTGFPANPSSTNYWVDVVFVLSP